ncbi:Uncharacterized protein APZ42_001915, partial [Daphnia magna]
DVTCLVFHYRELGCGQKLRGSARKEPRFRAECGYGGPLGQKKRKVPERYSLPPASGIPLKKPANHLLLRRLSKTSSDESHDPPYLSIDAT